MIKIRDLNFTYPGAQEPNLKHITLDIEDGDFLAIIGSNGCGKSTLCKTLNGLIPHFLVGDYEGEVEVDGLDTEDYTIGELATKVGYVYQDFENQIVRPTVLDDASFACLNYAMEDYKERGREALRLIGLSQKEEDYVWQLSGGQKHLLALAGVTALRPGIIVLDEPIAQLDPRHAKKTYEVLRYLNESCGKTIIVIEHHTEFIAEYCKNVVMMKAGQVMWKLPAREALTKVEELEACDIYPPQVTLAAKKLSDSGLIEAKGPLPTTVEEGELYFEAIKHKDRIDLPLQIGEEVGETIVSFQNVSVEYRAIKGQNSKILSDFSLDIHRGERIALIGSNGAGKSTIMKLMTGLLKPSKGEVLVYGEPTKRHTPEELFQKISLVYQNPEEMFIKDSIYKDIEYAMKVREVPDYKERTQELMKRFNLTSLQDRDGRLLSGGQMRRASLAVGIALNPSILLLDEPTANLDIATRKEIVKTLEKLKDVVETAIIATHDMQLVAEWADRIIVLSSGYIMADGTREEVFADQYVTESVGILPPEIYRMGRVLHEGASCFTVDEFIRGLGYVEVNRKYCG